MIRPTEDRIFIRRFPPIDQIGSIVLPDIAQETLHEGEVVAVGPGKVLKDGGHRPMALNVGDKISFGFRADDTFKVDGEEFVCIREGDVIGWVE